MTTNTNAASVAAVIACVLAELDGYDPKDQHCGLYDLRWSGGPNPEPEGDAWHMDYLPKAEKIAAALASPGAVAAEPSGWRPIETAPKNGTTVLVYPPTWEGRSCATASYNPDSYAARPRPYWERDDAFGKVTYSRDKPPTHWMPLPAAPKE